MKLQRFSNGKVSRWALSGDQAALNDYMAKVVPQGQMALFSLNILAGISEAIDPFLEVTGDEPFAPFSWETFPAASPATIAIAMVLTEEPRPQIAIDWAQLEATPEAVRFQLSHNTWDCFSTGIVHGGAFELARFITRKNETGIIKSIQTSLNFESNDYRWPRGDESWFKRELDPGLVGDVHVKWAIKIENIGDVAPDPNNFRFINTTSLANWISELPGMVHPEISPWEEMLFLWGRDHYIRLRCPANSLTSLWVFAYTNANPTDTWTAGGMLKGQCQVEESERTYCNMTRMD
jgi:hypothetical protein